MAKLNYVLCHQNDTPVKVGHIVNRKRYGTPFYVVGWKEPRTMISPGILIVSKEPGVLPYLEFKPSEFSLKWTAISISCHQ